MALRLDVDGIGAAENLLMSVAKPELIAVATPVPPLSAVSLANKAVRTAFI